MGIKIITFDPYDLVKEILARMQELDHYSLSPESIIEMVIRPASAAEYDDLDHKGYTTLVRRYLIEYLHDELDASFSDVQSVSFNQDDTLMQLTVRVVDE